MTDINNKIVSCNRLIFNLVCSFNAIESHYKKLLNNDDFEKFKIQVTSKRYDSSLNYIFLYQLRNFVCHNMLPITNATSLVVLLYLPITVI